MPPGRGNARNADGTRARAAARQTRSPRRRCRRSRSRAAPSRSWTSDRKLVTGRLAVGREAPVLDELAAVERAEVRLSVADVDREKHETIITKHAGYAQPESRRALWTHVADCDALDALLRSPRDERLGRATCRQAASSSGAARRAGPARSAVSASSGCGSDEVRHRRSEVVDQQQVDVDRPRAVPSAHPVAAPELASIRLQTASTSRGSSAVSTLDDRVVEVAAGRVTSPTGSVS